MKITITFATSLRALALAGLAAGSLVLATPARAAFLFTLTETAQGVTVLGSGTINTTALTPGLTNSGSASIFPDLGGLAVGATPPMNGAQLFSGISGPGSFGGGGLTNADDSLGNIVVVVGTQGALYVPTGYVSGSQLADAAIFAGATFDSLGFTPGTYTYTWGTGADADSLTITSDPNFGVAPEPSTWALLAVSVGGLGLAWHRGAARS